jgi:nicotinate phosphoribosyltransferase
MSQDLALRVHNHNYGLDPYVRSLLDTDFYKILMACFIWQKYPDVEVAFKVKNRSAAKFRFADVITEESLRAQLDYVKSLRFTNSELIWLQGNTFYGQTGIFPPAFIEELRNLRLPDYRLSIGEDGEFDLEFQGNWLQNTLWEIYALSILNEAKARIGMQNMSKYQLRVLYANATAKLVGKLKDLREAGVNGIAEFGTRRRHGFLWQEFAIEAMNEELGDAFFGTSNALHAMRQGLPAIGTNAHELPMVIAAVQRLVMLDNIDRGEALDTKAFFDAQFEVLRQWQEVYSGNLLVGLPDTFGTTQFLKAAPEAFPGISDWRGFREDSKDPVIGAEEKIAFWQGLGQDPRSKLQLFSDGLDVAQMINLHGRFKDRIQCGYGWGTLATNDFRGCDPRGGSAMDPVSVVCKPSLVELQGRSITPVKLSDNYSKATGAEEEVAFYRDVFGSEGMANAPVTV